MRGEMEVAGDGAALSIFAQKEKDVERNGKRGVKRPFDWTVGLDDIVRKRRRDGDPA